MFIVWGKRKVTRNRGYVAEFCPICRSIQPWRVKDIQMVGHLYFIPVGTGKPVSQRITCTGCRRTIQVRPFTYGSFVTDRSMDLTTLIRKTRPGLLSEITDRLVLEERLRGAGQPLTHDERMQLIAEPVFALADDVQEGLGGRTQVRLGSLLSLLLTVCLAVAFLAAGPIAGVILGVLSALSLVGTIYAFSTQSRRWIKRRIVPLLVKALTPLQPTRAELTDILQHLRDRGLRIGKKLNAEWVLEAMRPAGTTSARDLSFRR